MRVKDYPDSTEFIKTSPTSGGPPTLHLHENCPHVRKSDRWVRKPAGVLFEDRNVCDWCAGKDIEAE